MFIISYLRKKRTITENQQTLEHLDDDFIVIQQDNIRNEETSKALGSASSLRPDESSDKSVADCNLLRGDSGSTSRLSRDEDKKKDILIDINQENSIKTSDKWVSASRVTNCNDSFSCAKLDHKRDEKNDNKSFLASGLRPDEENQLIDKKLSICNKITLLAKMLLKKISHL